MSNSLSRPLPMPSMLAKARKMKVKVEGKRNTCASVSAAGAFLQAGGYGWWSKKYGTAAENLLRARVVRGTAAVLRGLLCST